MRQHGRGGGQRNNDDKGHSNKKIKRMVASLVAKANKSSTSEQKEQGEIAQALCGFISEVNAQQGTTQPAQVGSAAAVVTPQKSTMDIAMVAAGKLQGILKSKRSHKGSKAPGS